MVDGKGEFKGETTATMKKHGVDIHQAQPGHQRRKVFVESFHRWHVQRLFREQYQKELTTNKNNCEWISMRQTVVADINSIKTCLTGISPVEGIKMKQVYTAG